MPTFREEPVLGHHVPEMGPKAKDSIDIYQPNLGALSHKTQIRAYNYSLFSF